MENNKLTGSGNKSLYTNKIYTGILKPMFDYYSVKYDDEIVNSFCKILSTYNYEILSSVRDELLTEYRTFPKLPNWIDKCKSKLENGVFTTNSILNINHKLREAIETLKNDNDWLYVQNEFKKKFTEETFNAWLKNTSLAIKTDKTILLSAETEFVADYINKNFMNGTKIKHSSGDYYWAKKGIREFWQQAKPNIEKVEIKSIQEIDSLFLKVEKDLKNKEQLYKEQLKEVQND